METEWAIVARSRGEEEEMFGGGKMSWVLNIVVVTQSSASVKIHRTVHRKGAHFPLFHLISEHHWEPNSQAASPKEKQGIPNVRDAPWMLSALALVI